MAKDKTLVLPPWHGELGWEVMSWVPRCRKMARGYRNVIATSFADSEPLYRDFAAEFKINNASGRSLDYPKAYRPDGDYYRYGDSQRALYAQDVLIHARGVNRKNSINYRNWPALAKLISDMGLTTAFIGSALDQHVSGYLDFRGTDLQELTDRIAAAKLVVGVSSGVMHLAAACGTDLVVWGDGRTYFGETLERRYKMTWNPFEVRVGWITAGDWQPQPQEIINKIKIVLRKTEQDQQLRDLMGHVI